MGSCELQLHALKQKKRTDSGQHSADAGIEFTEGLAGTSSGHSGDIEGVCSRSQMIRLSTRKGLVSGGYILS